ncbi:MAG: amidase [Bryobacteraceae bacterium]
MLNQSAIAMANMIRRREMPSLELITAHLERIQQVNPAINAITDLLADAALLQAEAADRMLAAGDACGPLHGVPFSIKDSIDLEGRSTTAGTVGRKHASPALQDATLVQRLRSAGAIPIAKTNLPDLLFAFETDNLLFGRTNNPYDITRTPGGSSGGESALIAACGSPLGLGSDAAGSVRIPAAFCGIASIKPTQGRLPRTGHVPPAGGWIADLWQIGPMARHSEDLLLAMHLLAGEDGLDFSAPPVPLLKPEASQATRVAFFTYNGTARCTPEVENAVRRCADFLSRTGVIVEERTPPFVEQAFELELSLLGADGVDGIDAYLSAHASTRIHPLLGGFLDRLRPFRATASQLATRWAQWDEYRSALARFFQQFDAIVCPVYTQPALAHGDSLKGANFEGFSYTMAWNVAGAPAATVRCAEGGGLPINVQIVTRPWRDVLALEICQLIEREFGGWRPPVIPLQKSLQSRQ